MDDTSLFGLNGLKFSSISPKFCRHSYLLFTNVLPSLQNALRSDIPELLSFGIFSLKNLPFWWLQSQSICQKLSTTMSNSHFFSDIITLKCLMAFSTRNWRNVINFFLCCFCLLSLTIYQYFIWNILHPMPSFS